jgi:hypothetical protein
MRGLPFPSRSQHSSARSINIKMQLSPRLSDASGTVNPTTNFPLVYSIDVEAVATGYGHNDRAVAQISLVDMNERVRKGDFRAMQPPS